MASRWRADGGQTLKAGLVVGSGPKLLTNHICFVIFQVEPPSGSAHGHSDTSMYDATQCLKSKSQSNCYPRLVFFGFGTFKRLVCTTIIYMIILYNVESTVA